MKRLPVFIALLSLLMGFYNASAQLGKKLEDPTTWTYEARPKGNGEYDLVFHLELKKDWHVWASEPGGDGLLIPTTFSFDEQAGVEPVGKITEVGTKVTEVMEGVDGAVNYYADKVDFIQTVKAKEVKQITGKLEYQSCSGSMCLPPKQQSFIFTIKE